MQREKKTVKIYLENWEELMREKAKTGKSLADYIEELQKMSNGGDITANKILKKQKK